MERTPESAARNRDVEAALLNSDIPNAAEDKVLTALERAGVNAPSADLIGFCQRNAVATRDELRNVGFDATAVRGWVVDTDNHIVPRNLSEAIERGVVHWWVEVHIHGRWYTIDLAANSDDDWGDLYIDPERPPSYRPHDIDPEDIETIREDYGLEPPEGVFDKPL